MLQVLETVPDVTAPTAGVLGLDRLAKGATHPEPFVAYTWQGRAVVTFTASGGYSDRAKLVFVTWLSGLAPVGKTPDDMGATRIEALWNGRCGVAAGTMTD